jgi:hypothetical protein
MRDSDIDDERPRSRRRRDDRGRSRGRKDEPRKKRASPALVLGLAVGGFALLLGIGILIYLVARDTSKPAANDLLAHAPSDAIILSGYDLEELGRRDAFRKAMERRAPPDIVELDRAGLRTADLARALVARTANNGNACAIRFKTVPDQSKYIEMKLPGRNYGTFVSLTGNYKFGYFADDKTLVLADKEAAIQALRDKGSGRLSGDLQAMVDRVRGPVWRASGRLTANDLEKLGTGNDAFAVRVGPTSGTAAWLVPDGRLADVRFELIFESSSQARQSVATLRGVFLAQRNTNELGQLVNIREGTDSADFIDIRRGYEEASVSDSGTRVTAKLQLPAGEALRAVGSVRY